MATTFYVTEQQLLIAVHGYLRRLKLDSSIPKELKSLVFEFSKMWFNWNEDGHRKIGHNMKFYELDPLTFTVNKKHIWQVIVLTEYVLSKEQYDTFEWEIKIKSTEANQKIVLQMGFVDEKDIEKSMTPIQCFFNHSQRNNEVKPYLCYLNSYDGMNRCNLYGRGQYMGAPTPIGKLAVKDMIKMNDRVKLLFDFVKKECHLYRNDKFIAVIYNNIPDSIVPGIAVYSDVTIECTKFDAP